MVFNHMSKQTTDRTKLAQIPLFQNLSEDAVSKLEDILIEREFSKNETIFTEGDDSSGFYIICRGRVKVFKLSSEGKEQILHIVGSKELLGAVSAFAGNPYPANADAMEKTAAYFEHDGEPCDAAPPLYTGDRKPLSEGGPRSTRGISALSLQAQQMR
jgi:hypothetical protein